ncbi:rhomboid family intramembrane serine protease [Halomarina pelagica]|uniref:rhomboid family intramembrane serine protease n=1 Tax=Halomarina pelagica TaxID=2961599 RepID=UPI0020C36E63|nr:rhomboid family intramembrane serine protease [Halomarina sp. BND7]
MKIHTTFGNATIFDRSGGYRSPTVEVIALFALLYLVRLGTSVPTALAFPLSRAPWTLVTSVYTHASLWHLLGNTVGVLILGVGVERITTPKRFHAFFYATGVLSGLSEITVRAFLGTGVPVLGASGGMLALFGYAMVANPVTYRMIVGLDIDPKIETMGFLSLSGVIVVAGASPNVAIVAHFVGLLLGIGAGRIRLLHAEPSDSLTSRR